MLGKKLPNGLFGFFNGNTIAIWPHELFAGLFHYHRKAFDKFILGGNSGCVREFWSRMPTRQGMTNTPNWRDQLVPLALHGDGVAVSNVRGKGSKTVDTLSWTSLLSSASSKFSVFLIWFIQSHMVKTLGMMTTWRSFWWRLAKSLRALFDGTWPHIGMNGAPDPRGGQPLAGGFRGILYAVRGDLEWMSKHYELNHPASNLPCSLCACSNYGEDRDLYPWTDVNDPPSWLPTCLTDEVGVWGWGKGVHNFLATLLAHKKTTTPKPKNETINPNWGT